MTKQLQVEAQKPLETSHPNSAALPLRATEPTAVTTPIAQRPGLWLLAIVALALAVRLWQINSPFELDEFGPLYAVAERAVAPGSFPKASDPFVLASSLQEVRERSLLPFAIPNPHPLFNYVIYGVVQVLPIAEWSLRLPSLLAGLGCVVGLYFLCRRWLDADVALTAALLTAMDPIQLGSSVLCRPYALSNLAGLLTFAALMELLFARRTVVVVCAGMVYAAALAAIGYLQPALLLIGFGHLGLVVYALWARPEAGRWPRAAFWLASCLLAGLLLLPELGYLQAVRAFSQENREYLISFSRAGLSAFFVHNGSILAALGVLTVAGYVLREMRAAPANTDTAAEPTQESKGTDTTAPTLPAEQVGPAHEDNPELVWAARLWLFLPQLVALMLVYLSRMVIFSSRYLSYTSLGGVILLAYSATCDRSRDARLGMGLAVALTLLAWGLLPPRWQSYALHTQWFSLSVVQEMDRLEEEGRWKPGDVLLFRAGFLEGDLLPNRVPEASRRHIEKLVASPLTTLYAPKTPKPFVLLSLSHHFGNSGTSAGADYNPEPFYTPALAATIRQYERFWVYSDPWNQRAYMYCLVPWLANAVQWDLKVARSRPDPERYFEVCTDVQPDDFVAGLSDSQPTDFTRLVLIRRKQPKGVFTLGALTAGPMPYSYLTVPLWLASQQQNPRLTVKVEDDLVPEARDLDAAKR